MLARVSSHLRHNLVAYLALFVALGGTSAYAAGTIGSDDVIDESLLSQDIKDGEVKNSDLGTSSVTSAKINDGSVQPAEIGANAVTSAKINDGSVQFADIGPSAINSAKVRNEELLSEDVKDDTLTGDDISEGSLNVPLANALRTEGAAGLTTQTAADNVGAPAGQTAEFDVANRGTLTFKCNASSYNFSYENKTVSSFDAWMDVGGGDAIFKDLGAFAAGDGDTIASGNNTGASNTGEAITLRLSSGPIVVTVWAFGSRRSSGFCDFSVQALWAEQ